MFKLLSAQPTLAAVGFVVTLAVAPFAGTSALAGSFAPSGSLLKAYPSLVEAARARGGAHMRGAAVARGPRGGAVARGPHGAVARGPGGHVTAVRPGYRPPVPPRGAWRRPASYWWRPGGAIAAGAAVGFVTAAAAAAYAGPAPAPGYCWYYTNPQRTQGFWDVCPR